MKRTLITIGAFIAVVAIGGFLVAWSGIYSVAASEGHSPIARWFLTFGMRNSVELHSINIKAPPLDDPALILRGAGHYQGGCAPCHGAPGEARNPIVQSMLPPPPYLVDQLQEWDSAELFWIVKHGIKYAGMPAWVTQRRDDEVWSVVAFLERMPGMSAEEYQGLARGESGSFGRLVAENVEILALTGPIGASIAACARCHELDGSGRGVGAFPRLTGQRAPYLESALRDYASGARPSGIMQPVAAQLTEAQIKALAEYYAGIEDAPYPPGPKPDSRLLKLGSALALAGASDKGIPPCASCHGPGAEPRDPHYPTLAGQYADYLALQLRLFKQGVRSDTAYAQIMSAIARRLTEEQIRAVSLFYASLRDDQAQGQRGEDE